MCIHCGCPIDTSELNAVELNPTKKIQKKWWLIFAPILVAAVIAVVMLTRVYPAHFKGVYVDDVDEILTYYVFEPHSFLEKLKIRKYGISDSVGAWYFYLPGFYGVEGEPISKGYYLQ